MKDLLQRRDMWIVLTALVLLGAMVWRQWPIQGAAPGVASPPQSSSPSPKPDRNKGVVSLGRSRMDANAALAMVNQWRRTGLPDPMGMAPPPKPTGPTNAWAGFESLRLSGIWIQAGRRFAVINQRVLTEGDEIGAFRLERCEEERVWIAGPGASRPLAMPSRDFRRTAQPGPRQSALPSIAQQASAP